MSKALIPYVPRPGYTQIMQKAQEAAFCLSFAAQQNDTRLRDCTDIYGWLRAATLLPKGFTVENPYIFKVSKIAGGVEKSLIVLGTMHSLPLEIYPKPLLDMLLRQTVLVVEPEQAQPTHQQEESEEARSAEGDSETVEAPNMIEQQNIEVADWFEELPERTQHYLADIIGGVPNTLARPVDIQVYLWQILTSHGMDDGLIAIYKSQNRTVVGLESMEECIEEELNSTDYELLDDLTQGIEESLSCGGIVARPEHISIMASYLTGRYLTLSEHNPNVSKRSMKWMNKLSKILYEHPTETLVAVGLAHLFSEGGLIATMSQDGYNIERADLTGEFHPFDFQELVG